MKFYIPYFLPLCLWLHFSRSLLLDRPNCCSSFTKSCPTLCDPINCSTPWTEDFLVLHCLLEYAQTHVHWVSDAIQLSHPVLSPSPPAINLSQHQSLFQRVGSLHQVAKVLKLQLQASVLPVSSWGWYPLGLIGLISLQLISRVFSSTTIQKHQVFGPD